LEVEHLVDVGWDLFVIAALVMVFVRMVWSGAWVAVLVGMLGLLFSLIKPLQVLHKAFPNLHIPNMLLQAKKLLTFLTSFLTP